jgi:hypothetical protein
MVNWKAGKSTGNKPAKRVTSLVSSMCVLLATAGVVGDGVFRWILISVAAVIAAALAVGAIRREFGH